MSKSQRAAITGMGAAAPEKVMTNADFEKILDTSDEWITKRTGIKNRHVVSDGQSTVTLGTEAARKALADAGVKPAPFVALTVYVMSWPGATVARSAFLSSVRFAEVDEVTARTWSTLVPFPAEVAVTETRQAGEPPLTVPWGMTRRVHVVPAPAAIPVIVYPPPITAAVRSVDVLSRYWIV